MNSNWSIKLQVGDGGVDGYNEFELVYKASTQERHKLTQMGSIRGQAPVILQHRSDSQAGVPARAVEENKTGEWQLSILDDENVTPEWDTILNNVSRLNRLYSGATSTAVRNAMYGTAERVRIAILPEGATNITYHDIQWGHADTSSVYYEKVSQQADNTKTARGAWFIPIKFTFKDSGYGASFELRNDLPSSPHMIEDSNGDGLADGLVLFGVPTPSISVSQWLIGGKSQKLVTDDVSDAGVYTGIVPAAAGTDAVFVCYLLVLDTIGGAGDPVNVLLRGGTPGTSIVNTSTPDSYIISPQGATWAKYVLSGNNGTDTGFFVQIRRFSTSATKETQIFVDGMYLQTGTLTTPDGWCSSSSLKNRYDPTSTSAATQQQINYLDVWGIPGDLPATVKQSIVVDKNDSVPSIVTIGKGQDAELLPDTIYKLELEDMLTVGGWATVADATRSDGAYKRNSNAGTTEQNSYTFPAGIGQSLLKSQWRVFGVVRSQLNTSTVQVEILNTTLLTATIPATAANTWILLDLGLYNGVGQVNPDSFDLYPLPVFINSTAVSASNIDYDCLFFVPASEFLVVDPQGLGGDFTLIVDPEKQQAFALGAENGPSIGSLWNALPQERTRFIYMLSNSNSQLYDLDTEYDLTLTVTPRTQHLLGTS